LEKVRTPGKKSIEDVAAFLRVEPHRTAKAVFYESDADGRPVLAVIRGDLEINELKLAKIIRAAPVAAEEETIRSTGSVPGYASPMGLDPDTVRLIVDRSLAGSNNLVTGANEVDYHLKHFNLDRDLPGVETVDIAIAHEGDGCPHCDGRLVMQRGIEVGNIFQLGTKYTEAMGMTYLDENGKTQTPIMGCYGIGVGRAMASAMEVRHDKWGPIWPIAIAPWQVHINAIKYAKPEVKAAAEKLYADLCVAGIEAVLDDRNERPGVQFADADLLGVPLRLIVSEKHLANHEVEYKQRGTDIKGTMPLGEAVVRLRDWIAEALKEIEAKADGVSNTPS
jgi:prolyl-tRNA synthetase